MEKVEKSDAEVLRQRAEELLTKGTSKSGIRLSKSETKRLFHEMEVYEIELEMVKEELKLAKSEAHDATQKYTELSDLIISQVVRQRKIS